MLQLLLLPQQAADSGDFVLQQDGAPPHWNINVRRYLNDELPHRWIGRVGEDDVALFPWPPLKHRFSFRRLHGVRSSNLGLFV
jgi:hypothetical protein